MKFIGTIRQTKLEDETKIYIDKVHRAATGALSGSKLYAYPVFEERNKHKYREVIFSQYPPKCWHNIFRLRFWAQDKPGVTKTIFEKLKNAGILITTQESIMTKYHDHYFTISMVADFTKVFEYGKEYFVLHDNFDTVEDKLEELNEKILKKIFNNCEELDYERIMDNPSIKPLRQLNYHSGRYNTIKQVNDIALEDQESNRPDVTYHNDVTIYEGYIYINRRIIDVIQLRDTGNIFYTVNSDTDEKYLIVRFFDPQRKIIQLDIEHYSHVLGTLFKFANEIKKVDGYNIINSFDRIQDHQKTSHWVVMIDCTSNSNEILNLLVKLRKQTDKKVSVICATDSFIAEEKELGDLINECTINYFGKEEKSNSQKKVTEEQYLKDKSDLKRKFRHLISFIIIGFFVVFVNLIEPDDYFPEKIWGFSTVNILTIISILAILANGLVDKDYVRFMSKWIMERTKRKE